MKFFKKKNNNKFLITNINSIVNVSAQANIFDTKINLYNSKLIIEQGVSISNYQISITNGELIINKDSILEKGASYTTPDIYINRGNVFIENNVSLRTSMSVRFGGSISIGEYTCVNENSLIRADESVRIGKYCMVSYECLIFDTNTHEILPLEERRSRTKKDFPYIGEEIAKPITAPVIIGNDCWIGQRAIILKGVELGDGVIVGIGTTVTKPSPVNQIIVSAESRTIKKNKT